jgi:chorismate-pyruvate lyase
LFGFGRSAEQKAADEFAKSPLGVRLRKHSDEYFGENKVFGRYEAETKEWIIGSLLTRRHRSVFGASWLKDRRLCRR